MQLSSYEVFDCNDYDVAYRPQK